MNNILLPDVEKQIKIYLETKHPNDSNGFIIRLSTKLNLTYEMRKSYIVRFPIINQNMIEQINIENLLIFNSSLSILVYSFEQAASVNNNVKLNNKTIIFFIYITSKIIISYIFYLQIKKP